MYSAEPVASASLARLKDVISWRAPRLIEAGGEVGAILEPRNSSQIPLYTPQPNSRNASIICYLMTPILA